MRTHAFIVSCALCGILAAGAAADVSFSDGVFNNADWNLAGYFFTGQADAPTAFGVSSGGNRGEYRRINHNNFTNIMVSYHLRNGAVYNPAVNGAIAAIDFSMDLAAIQNLNGINIAMHLCVFQNGVYYMSSGFINDQPRWMHFVTTGATAENFSQLGDGTSHPDFSGAGAPIQFGIVASNDNTGVFASRAVGVDNWGVVVNPNEPCPADISEDQQVNVIDLLAVINGWGACRPPCVPYCEADINHDCTVNVADLLAVINAWGACP